jgi:hypothetical protein
MWPRLARAYHSLHVPEHFAWGVRPDALVEEHRRKGGREATADEVGRLAGPAGRTATRPRALRDVRAVARALSRPVPDLRLQGHDGALRLPE